MGASQHISPPPELMIWIWADCSEVKWKYLAGSHLELGGTPRQIAAADTVSPPESGQTAAVASR
jgi:hypothetical protein